MSKVRMGQYVYITSTNKWKKTIKIRSSLFAPREMHLQLFRKNEQIKLDSYITNIGNNFVTRVKI